MKRINQLLLLFLISPLISALGSLNDYINQWSEVDESAVALCWIMNGQMSEVESGSGVKGHLCKARMSLWTADPKHAQEYCASRFPFPIVAYASVEEGGHAYTDCTFQINLFCDKTWTQIHNRCYKVPKTRYSYADANKACVKFKEDPKWKAGVALYYSDALAIAFSDMDIEDAWVTVPDIKEHFENGEGEATVFVQDGAFKYDTKPGTLMLPEGSEEHQPLCEYTPPMTKAEMYYMAHIYKEIYPIHVTNHGVTITSSSYLTLNSVPGSDLTFKSNDIKARCSAIGVILNTNSFPLVSLKEEYDDAKPGLNNHRFYLTAAHKNEGCSRKDYIDYDADGKDVQVFKQSRAQEKDYCNAHSFAFSSFANRHGDGRYPTPAAFRAPVLCSLHSYGFQYADCPTGWFTYIRAHGTKFCHFIENNVPLTYKDARDACTAKGAALSAFDSAAEFAYIRGILMSTHEPRSDLAIATGTHFRLGGSSPCRTNCYNPKVKLTFTAGWDEGVSRDTKFLNSSPNNWHPYQELYYKGTCPDLHLSFRHDMDEFHLHDESIWPTQFYICGKYADMVVVTKNVDFNLRINLTDFLVNKLTKLDILFQMTIGLEGIF